MNQYQRNRLPLTWELLDVKENEVELPYDDDYTLRDVNMIQQGIKNNKSDESFNKLGDYIFRRMQRRKCDEKDRQYNTHNDL